jgi:hypothetical protein
MVSLSLLFHSPHSHIFSLLIFSIEWLFFPWSQPPSLAYQGNKSPTLPSLAHKLPIDGSNSEFASPFPFSCAILKFSHPCFLIKLIFLSIVWMALLSSNCEY